MVRGPVVALIDFYRAQLRVLWTWRSGPLALVGRVLVSLAVSVASLLFAAWVLEGLRISDPLAPIAAAIALGLLYLLVRPLLLALVAPVSGILVAIVALALQSVPVMVVAPLVPGLEIDGFGTAFWAAWIIAVVNTVLTAVFAIDSGDSYFGALVHQLITRDAKRIDEPGVVIVQVDGLAHDILRHQVRAGRVPVLSRWLRSGSHRLVRWIVLLPSQTSASQAGILHGNNDDIPAFRWYEKDTGRLMVSNRPRDAAEIVRRVSNGEGLLSRGGTSIANAVTGDAARSYLTMAVLADRDQGIGSSRAFYGFFLSPYNFLHTLIRFVGEIVKERYQARRQRRAGIEPRLDRGRVYAFLRAVTNVVLRDLGTTLAMEEMYRGTPVIYIDYTDYDEVAHHSGPERAEALDALDGVDRAIGSLERAARDAPRPYHFIVLSDHGQTLGATFRQRYGVSLEGTVRALLGGDTEVVAATSEREEWGPINKFLSELSSSRGATPAIARAALRRQRDEGGHVEAGPDDAQSLDEPGRRSDVVVIASGNLGLISFPALPGRQTFESISARHPGFLDALANHPGVGLLLVRSDSRGGIAVGRDGICYLDDGRVEGVDPIQPYGPYALMSLRRLDGMANAPDVALISAVDPETEEVAAFEELIGSHGGMGGPQNRAFVLFPADWDRPPGELVGAPAVYRQLRTWLAALDLGPGARGPATAQARTERGDCESGRPSLGTASAVSER